MGRSRSRSASRDKKRRRSHERKNRDDATTATRTTTQRTNNTNRTSLSAAGKSLDQLNPNCCLRYGVIAPKVFVNESQIVDEMDSIRMMHRVEHVAMEPNVDRDYWAQIYFVTPDDADTACTELNMPFRTSKFRFTVSQRLPLAGSMSGEIRTIPVFEPLVVNPPDTVVVDTQEGYVSFSTDELYSSKGALDYLDTKRSQGKIIRRLICKHFDPQRRIPCRYGVSCAFVHIKAFAMVRLLRTVSYKQQLRFAKSEEDVQVSSWDFERRHDALIVRHLADDFSVDGLRYMFEACPGFVGCAVQLCRDESRYGVVRFGTREAASDAMLQTKDSNLCIHFHGVMEDVRRMQMHEAKAKGQIPTQISTTQQRSGFRDSHRQNNFSNNNNNSDTTAVALRSAGPHPVEQQHVSGEKEKNAAEESVPFPQVPEGWSHGISRRNGQYYFFQLNSKAPTQWKHPQTNEGYSVNSQKVA